MTKKSAAGKQVAQRWTYPPKAVNDGDLLGRAQFCALGVLVTDRLSRFVGLPEALRLFSREIEHSEDNLDTLLEQFWHCLLYTSDAADEL